MNEYVTSTLLIVDYKKYSTDVVFIGISPYDGQKYVVVKGGSNGISRRAKLIDLGNAIKAKIYQRNHWYLSESEPVNSFSFIKKDLNLIILYQALLAILKVAYVLPEKKLYFSIYNTLTAIPDIPDKEKRELSLFLLIMRVMAYYELTTFPFVCAVCNKRIYEGHYIPASGQYTCVDHKQPDSVRFSIKDHEGRISFLQFVLKHLLNIRFTYESIHKWNLDTKDAVLPEITKE